MRYVYYLRVIISYLKAENVPHLYLIDINLVGVSGLEICKRIKSQKARRRCSIVIVISANPDVRRLAAEAFADDALPKPFTTKELLGKISKCFPVSFGVRTVL